MKDNTSKPINDASSCITDGINKMCQGKHEDALLSFNQALACEPNNSWVHYQRGQCLANLKQYKLAIAELSTAIDLGESDPFVYMERGDSYFKVERYDDAIKDYDKVIDLKSEEELFVDVFVRAAYHNRGVAKAMLEKYEEAIIDFDKAIALGPDESSSYHRRFQAKYALKRFAEAIDDINEMIKRNPNDFHLYSIRAGIKRELGLNEDADNDMKKWAWNGLHDMGQLMHNLKKENKKTELAEFENIKKNAVKCAEILGQSTESFQSADNEQDLAQLIGEILAVTKQA